MRSFYFPTKYKKVNHPQYWHIQRVLIVFLLTVRCRLASINGRKTMLSRFYMMHMREIYYLFVKAWTVHICFIFTQCVKPMLSQCSKHVKQKLMLFDRTNHLHSWHMYASWMQWQSIFRSWIPSLTLSLSVPMTCIPQKN